jgi:DNA-binding transcriptional LysR family regulator
MWRNWKKSLGARLLHRTSRRLSLTEAGTVYFEQCKVALDTLLGAEASIGRSTQTPRGQLKLSAPVWCANRRFAEILCAYRERYPEVVVDIRLENRKVDLAAEGFDLALRPQGNHPPSSSPGPCVRFLSCWWRTTWRPAASCTCCRSTRRPAPRSLPYIPVASTCCPSCAASSTIYAMRCNRGMRNQPDGCVDTAFERPDRTDRHAPCGGP